MAVQGRYRLTVRQGPTPGKMYELVKDVTTVGRDVRSDVVVNDAEVSRSHVRLTAQADGFLVEDLASTNGTFINGQRLTGPKVLHPNDMFGLGETVVMQLELIDPQATVVKPATMSDAAMAPPPSAGAVRTAPLVGNAPEFAAAPEGEAASDAAAPRRKWLPYALGACGCLTLCGCVSLVAIGWYLETNNLWCQFLPFLPGCS
jgi:predicted component of type VI protein secretion system